MPGLDRTGPSGQGPMTGRGRGMGVGSATGFGRGIGFGYGAGRGLGRRIGAGRGLGLGRGFGIQGGAQGRGAAAVAVCTCPECGRTEPHPRGIPCTQMECPKCGVPMRGDYCLPKNAQEDLKDPQENLKTQRS